MSSTTEPNKPVQKLLILGDRYIGKSFLMYRYSDNSFVFDSFNPYKVIGVDFRIKQYEHNGTQIKLQVWDTPAGRERFLHVTSHYYRGAHGIVLCFDLTNEESFKHLDFWFSEIEKYTTDASVMLLGLKSDLIDKRAVDEDKIQLLAVEKGVQYFEVSSKTGENVNEAINGFVDQLILKNCQKFNHEHSVDPSVETKEGTCTIL